jgi:hypothetical protein
MIFMESPLYDSATSSTKSPRPKNAFQVTENDAKITAKRNRFRREARAIRLGAKRD